MNTALVVSYQDERGISLKVTAEDVRRFLVHGNEVLTDREIARFLWLCQYQGLNPFLGDAYLIKYGSDAQQVVSKDVHSRRANSNPNYDGIESGVIILDANGALTQRPGAFYLIDSERLVGGWARAWRKDQSHPVFVSVLFDEYAGRTKDGELNKQWRTKGATMIVKVAESQAWRKVCPELEKLYTAEEVGYAEEVIQPQSESPGNELVTQTSVKVVLPGTSEGTTGNGNPKEDALPSVETDRAAELYRQLEAKYKSTNVLSDAIRKEALDKLPAHRGNVAYLSGKLRQIQEKEEIARLADQAMGEAPKHVHRESPFEEVSAEDGKA